MRKAVLPAIIFLFISCNKEPLAATNVLLRISNETPKTFKQVLTSTESFDNVKAMSTTGYQSFQQIISVPSAILINNNDTVSAGLVVIDWPTYITMGKYMLKIKTDTLTASGYSCEYVQE